MKHARVKAYCPAFAPASASASLERGKSSCRSTRTTSIVWLGDGAPSVCCSQSLQKAKGVLVSRTGSFEDEAFPRPPDREAEEEDDDEDAPPPEPHHAEEEP